MGNHAVDVIKLDNIWLVYIQNTTKKYIKTVTI